jgi:acyl phosphate:glycerol-3-phosphate acyltransferase
MWIYLLPILGYLLGSVSSAIVVARLLGLRDPREVGSGNPGATNILRYGGKIAAVVVLLGDALKGVVAVLIARWLTDDLWIVALTGGAAFLGHLFPIFFRFRGGKGVATAFGVWLALVPWVGVAMVATWLAIAAIFRYSSLSALVATAAGPLYVWWLAPESAYLSVMVVMALLLFYRHRSNISNLIAGREGRIGSKTSASGNSD